MFTANEASESLGDGGLCASPLECEFSGARSDWVSDRLPALALVAGDEKSVRKRIRDR